jgi:Tfp pilus assembly protein PilZ
MNNAIKAGTTVVWVKLQGEERRANWTGVVLKADENGYVVEWTRDGDTSGKTKVQSHRGEQASRVVLPPKKEETK